ncbi:MAG: penicillin-binding protein 1B, partial [Pseudomonadales bacterium]|nr:penicillin-binding protein 1B [Pseudomonadales bacterium]
PMKIGGFYPNHHEDRDLIQLEEISPLFIESLITVEDRGYFEHHGVAWRSIVRALLVNIQAGKIEQGGSTLTQQLVKNFYLTDERSYWRKALEAVMALLLELHYDKAEILEAYLNEIYLGQNGDKGVHGLGLASAYYFGRTPEQLKLDQIALLVGIIKGPSYYNPRRHPERASKRRNQVLTILKDQGVITEQAYKSAIKKPLNIARKPRSNSPYPAYMDLVKRQLRRDYADKDLRNEGLRIFTALDPALQQVAETAMTKRMKQLEHGYKMPAESLQSAVVISSADGGEILGLIGGRDVRLPGFNRALDAVRPIGSLLKPAIYLTALEDYHLYHWGSLIEDAPIEIEAEEGNLWTPKNYDRRSHGQVTLLEALAKSYNQAAARLGMELGLPRVLETIRRLGLERDLPAYPAVLLGGTGLTPIEVASMYQTIASGGFNTPLRAIREVLDVDGKPLSRYPFTVGQRFEPQAIALLTEGLKEVMRNGTGRSAYSILPDHIDVAGKTGTTNGLRDSWFAGFSEDYLTIVWLGRDDNGKTPMTGSTGALRVWSDIMLGLNAHSLEPYQGDDIRHIWYDPMAGLRTGKRCQGAKQIPMHIESIPDQWTACGQGDKFIDRIKGLFR